MAYCTKADIEKLIPATTVTEVTDDEGTGAEVAARVSEAIAQADAEIDSYCGGRYAVPFDPVPAIIAKCSVDMAIYHLYSRTQETMPETRANRYKDAIRLLAAISKGEITLGAQGADAEPSADAAVPECNKTADDRIFTRTSMEGF